MRECVAICMTVLETQHNVRVLPPNITAWSSSVSQRETVTKRSGCFFIEGEDNKLGLVPMAISFSVVYYNDDILRA